MGQVVGNAATLTLHCGQMNFSLSSRTGKPIRINVACLLRVSTINLINNLGQRHSKLDILFRGPKLSHLTYRGVQLIRTIWLIRTVFREKT